MSALSLLPRDMTDLSVSVRHCHDPHHAHRNPRIEIVSFTWRGGQVIIETEAGSELYNVKAGNESIVQATATAAQKFLQEQTR